MDESEKRRVIAANCRKFRLEANLSQEDVAVFADASIDSVRGWEQGRRSPDRESLEKLARLYGRSMDDFVSENPPAPRKRRPLLATKLVGDEPPGMREELEAIARKYHYESLIARTEKKAELKKGKKR